MNQATRFQFTQFHWQKTCAVAKLATVLGLLCLCTGCVDGPLYALKKSNPYYRSQWAADREHGPTYDDRIAELKLLRSQIASMDVTEQQKWAKQLEVIIATDPSAEMRTHAILAISHVQSPETERTLNTASADDSEKVRMAVCKGWKNYGGAAARDMLLSLAQKEGETTSVKQAAIESLAAFNEPEVRQSLGRLLDNSSPAVQFQAVQSLAVLTERDYGGDVESWKQFLAGKEVPEPEPVSTATQIWNSLPNWR